MGTPAPVPARLPEPQAQIVGGMIAMLRREKQAEELAWESYVQGEMKRLKSTRRKVGRRLRRESFITGYRAGKAAR
jgi:hypothetical protein